MKRKLCVPLLSILLLSSCVPSIDSSNSSSADLNNSSNIVSDESTSITINDSTVVSKGWNSEISIEMISMLGTTIPYISEFGESYSYTKGYISQSNIPYINPFIENGSNWISKYQVAVVAEGYSFEDNDIDDGVTWYNYQKSINSSTLFLKFSYYASEGRNWFDIYAHLEGERSTDLPIPDESDIVISPSLFSTSSYRPALSTFLLNSISFTYTDVMNQNSMVQFKNKTGLLYNTNPVNNFDYIYLKNIDYMARISVYGGLSLDNMDILTSYNGVYNLLGFSYFKVCSNSSGVVKVEQIEIGLI